MELALRNEERRGCHRSSFLYIASNIILVMRGTEPRYRSTSLDGRISTSSFNAGYSFNVKKRNAHSKKLIDLAYLARDFAFPLIVTCGSWGFFIFNSLEVAFQNTNTVTDTFSNNCLSWAFRHASRRGQAHISSV